MLVQTRQQGGSAIGLIIFLLILGYGVFVGLQYVPQYIESRTVNMILENIQNKNETEPLGTIDAVRRAIENQLFINEMSDLNDSFKVTQYRGDITITAGFERELNLLYETKVMKYEKSVTLD